MPAGVRTAAPATVADRIITLARKLSSWPLHGIAAPLPVWLLRAALAGWLGVEPLEAMEHRLGEWGPRS